MNKDRYEIVETVDGDWMVLIDGVQAGNPPYDRSGASSETHATHEDAEAWITRDLTQRIDD